MNPTELREQACAAAWDLAQTLQLPQGTALAATGSFARGEMTPYSDLDLILIHPEGMELDKEAVAKLWYPVWDAKYRLDYAVRTPRECAEVITKDVAAGFSLLDLAFVAGEEDVVDETRALTYSAWRTYLQRNFAVIADAAIARWSRSGSLTTMTNPEIKNGRGGLRDLQLLRALALGQVCDKPDLDEHRNMLLDVRTLLHVHARRRRDVLDPEFAADVAAELGYPDRYDLTADIVAAATAIDQAVEQGLSTARGLVQRRMPSAVRHPLDIDVVDSAGRVTLARNANLDDAGLVLRVAAASARTGQPVADGVWNRLKSCPPLPERWPAQAAEDFITVLSSPQMTPRIIAELDAHGLWEKLIPEWPHIRGRMPRERTHTHSIDYHSVATVARCAENRTAVARPDLLLLSALFHDIGKGYGRPHEQVGAEIIARFAAKLRLHLPDRSRVQTIVAEHTTLARLAATMDPYSEQARDALLDAAHYDRLTISLLAALAEADAKSTGPGVWNSRVAGAIGIMTQRALDVLAPSIPQRPMVRAPGAVGLRREGGAPVVYWRGETTEELVKLLEVIAVQRWNISSADVVREPGGELAAEIAVRTVQGELSAADEAYFIQSYKSGQHAAPGRISGGHTTAVFNVGGVLEVRTADRRGALATLLGLVPEIEWLSMRNPGATMIVHTRLAGAVERTAVVRNVTNGLVNG